MLQKHPEMLTFQPVIDTKWKQMLATLDTITLKDGKKFLHPEQYKVAYMSLGQIAKNLTIVIVDKPHFTKVSLFGHSTIVISSFSSALG